MMMNTDSLYRHVESAVGAGAGVNLFFVLKRDDGQTEVKRADLQEGDTQTHLKAQFITALKEDFLEEERLQICELSEADERKEVIYHYDMEEFPESLKYFSEFDYRKKYDTFSFLDDDVMKIEAYLVVIGTQNHYCVLYKKFYSVFLLGRGSFCLVPSRNRFEEFDRELLRISQDYQFIKIGEQIFIKDIRVLEKFGGFKEIVEKNAVEAVKSIEEMELLAESEVLRETLKADVSFARKLCKIKKSSPVLQLDIPTDTILDFSRTHPGLAGKLKYEGNRILLTTKKSQNIFLKMLEDSYLTSDLTKLYYDSLAKEKIQ